MKLSYLHLAVRYGKWHKLVNVLRSDRWMQIVLKSIFDNEQVCDNLNSNYIKHALEIKGKCLFRQIPNMIETHCFLQVLRQILVTKYLWSSYLIKKGIVNPKIDFWVTEIWRDRKSVV